MNINDFLGTSETVTDLCQRESISETQFYDVKFVFIVLTSFVF